MSRSSAAPLAWALLVLVFAHCGGGGGAAPAGPPAPPNPPPGPAAIGNTGFINQPPLVTEGMAGLVASVPVQAGQTWTWSLQGGTIQGPIHNAALTFTAAPGATTLRTQCALTQGNQTTTYYQDSDVVPPLPLIPRRYGPGLNADALANTQVGGPAGQEVSYRFRSQTSGPLTAVRVFFIWDPVKAGYNAGTGGTIRVEVLADDGTPAHLPAGQALAATSYGGILAGTYYPLLSFAQPATLVADTLYHLRFKNVDPDPAANFVSVDSLYTDAQIAPAQPVLSDLDGAVLFRQAGQAWQQRPAFTPIVEYQFPTSSQGVGYMEVWSGNPKPISGDAQVRERFTVSGPSFTASGVMVRLQRKSGASPLTLSLDLGNGTRVEAGAVPASAVRVGSSWWVSYTFASPRTLASGNTYALTLSAPADTRYAAFPYRKGTDKGFSGRTVFLDGFAQFTNTGATGWTGWDQWGQSNRSDGDLQFLFF